MKAKESNKLSVNMKSLLGRPGQKETERERERERKTVNLVGQVVSARSLSLSLFIRVFHWLGEKSPIVKAKHD